MVSPAAGDLDKNNLALSQFLIVSQHLLNVKNPPSTARLIATSADTPNWRALLHGAQVCQRYREEIYLARIGQTKNRLGGALAKAVQMSWVSAPCLWNSRKKRLDSLAQVSSLPSARPP